MVTDSKLFEIVRQDKLNRASYSSEMNSFFQFRVFKLCPFKFHYKKKKMQITSTFNHTLDYFQLFSIFYYTYYQTRISNIKKLIFSRNLPISIKI